MYIRVKDKKKVDATQTKWRKLSGNRETLNKTDYQRLKSALRPPTKKKKTISHFFKSSGKLHC